MHADELYYHLPEALIARYPVEPRDASRLLIVYRNTRTFHEDVFANIGNYLHPGDALVLNNTRVIRARLHGKKPTGGHVELLLLREREQGLWESLVRPAARVRSGTRVELPHGIIATLEQREVSGKWLVRFSLTDIIAVLEEVGAIPLPPYLHRDAEPLDNERYQTVFAQKPGSVAAPTAGLHYTPALLQQIQQRGVHIHYVTLHVGYGTFKPITTERLEEHRVDPEPFEVDAETAETLTNVRAAGGRVVAVGTTVTRVLESVCRGERFTAQTGETDLYIYPPYTFRAVDVLQTNFHLPRSSLLALVCAFADKELIFSAYRYAIEKKFRFYSYGDAMLIV